MSVEIAKILLSEELFFGEVVHAIGSKGSGLGEDADCATHVDVEN